MSILVCGLNHRSAPLAVREQLAVAPEKHADYLARAMEHKAIREVAILSTCNRTELVCKTDQAKTVLEWLGQSHLQQDIDIQQYVYVYKNQKAVKHLMRVACGLDSMVLGEPQILGQLKQAYHQANQLGTIGPALGGVFRAVFGATKRVRSQTAIGANPVSVASAAANVAKQQLNSLNDKSVLLIGAGETIELAARYLHQQGIKSFTIANRHQLTAQDLGKLYQAKIIPLSDITKVLPSVDLVISATSAPEVLIESSSVASSMQLRNASPMLFIDLAIPRDIDPRSATIDGVTLLNIDDMADIINTSLNGRRDAANEAEQLIELELEKYTRWQNHLVAVEAIKAYRSTLKTMAQNEVQLAIKSLNNQQEPSVVLEQLATRLLNKAMHQPTKRLRDAGVAGRHDILELAKYLLSDVS